jgi:hypothetical protein
MTAKNGEKNGRIVWEKLEFSALLTSLGQNDRCP